MYYHPSLDTSVLDIVVSALIYGSFAIGIFITASIFYRNTRRLLLEQKRAHLKDEQYKVLMEHSGVSTITVDKRGIVRFMSENIHRLTGYENSEVIGKEMVQGVPREFRPVLADIVAKMDTTEEYEEIQVQLFTKSRVNVWVACHMYPLRDKHGKVSELLLMLWNIDKQKQMQLELEKLQEEESMRQALMQKVLDYSPSLVYIKDIRNHFLITNSKLKRFLGIQSTDELAKTLHERYPLIDQQQLDMDKQVIEKKKPVTYETEFVHPNGKITNLWIQKFPVLDEQGEVEMICGFDTDITQLKQSEQIILEAKREAELAKEAQEIFLANMSHEIRTPLNGIVGMGNLLLSTDVNEEQKDYLESIQESAQNLLAIINDLLDFSKIKSGKFHLDAIDFKPRSVIKKTMYPLLLRANEKGIALKCFIDTTVPETLKGDALRFQQILINIIANAIKFTSEGFVEVKVYSEPINNEKIFLIIDVTDTGIGIPPDKVESIFESYVQSDTNISRTYGGTGLGLAIVKQLVELQYGAVSATSELGKGSTFSIRVPYQVIMEQSEENNLPVRIDSSSNEEMLKDIKVLVAEDNLINQKVVSQTLKKQHAVVDVAGTGAAAIQMLKERSYDIILMDLQMPEMDGYTATQYIRQEMQNNIPIVAMTADALKGEADKCFEVGMNDYISKPFAPKDLYKKILYLTHRNDAGLL
ncbi:MAG: response regulator [Flavipsychrobacter sp.]